MIDPTQLLDDGWTLQVAWDIGPNDEVATFPGGRLKPVRRSRLDISGTTIVFCRPAQGDQT